MLKKIISSILAAGLAIALSACARNNFNSAISQLRTDILSGSADGCEFILYAEEREIPLSADGIPLEKSPVIILKATALSAFSGTYSVFIAFDGKEYSSLPEFRADNVLRAVIPVEKLPRGDVSVRLEGDKNYSADLSSVLPDGVCEYTAAVKTALSHLADKVTYSGGRLEGEIFARVLFENGNAYWYVGYVSGKNLYSVLVAGDGKTVVASRDGETQS